LTIICTAEFSNKFGKELLKWWEKNRREFPWRKTRDPYKILISEVLLHRTKAEQVVPIYIKITDCFPTIDSLSKAPLKQIHEMTYSLGLTWRVTALYRMVEILKNKYNCKIPETKKDLILLPGVSNYIAAAVRCFAFEIPDSILDTNTVRIIGRIFGIATKDGSRRSQELEDLYLALNSNFDCRKFGYALLDLGAILCRPKNPACSNCPVNIFCNYNLKMCFK